VSHSRFVQVHTMWYEENVSNFAIAVAKLKEILQTVKFATLCRSVCRHNLVAPKDFNLDQNTIPITLISHLL